MAEWYTKLQKEGWKVRGSVDTATNSFPKEKIYMYERNRSDGSYVRDEEVEKPKDANSFWKPPRIPIKEDSGNQKIKEEYIHRDVYVECGGGNRIFCSTADNFNCRKHTYYAELSTGRWNILRTFYNKYIGDESDYYFEVEGDMKFHNDLMLKKIKEDGTLFDFEELDTDIYFKCNDIDLLLKLLKAKRNGKKKDGTYTQRNPFHHDFLDWSNNRKAKVPDELEEKFTEAKLKTYGNPELGTEEATFRMQDVKAKNDAFCEKHGITEELRRREKIKDTDRIIYHLGLWDEYLKMWD